MKAIIRPKKIIFLIFNKIQNEYHIVFASGNDTDFEQIVKSIKLYEKNCGFDKKYDRSYAIFDLDNNKDKINRFLSKKYDDIKCIVSNPCFELWYLLHFVYTTKLFSSNNILIKELKKYIKNYDKSKDYFEELLYYSTEAALSNNKRLVDYYSNLKDDKFLEKTYTNVYEIVEIIYNANFKSLGH